MKIVSIILIAVFSVISFIFIFKIVGTSTGEGELYLPKTLVNLRNFLIFGFIDFLIFLFTKHIFGYNGLDDNIENIQKRFKRRAEEKARKKAENEAFKARQAEIHEEYKALKLKKKTEKQAAKAK